MLSIPELTQNISDDISFVEELISNYYINKELIAAAINDNTPKWDEDRLTQTDFVLLAMGLTEFRFCAFVPVKVTMNEYIEIAKMYSTPKSAKFINGTLDKILKIWQSDQLIQKKGRGLIG
jgi:N utilization substance protein B